MDVPAASCAFLQSSWPAPGDPAAADRLLERLDQHPVRAEPGTEPMLRCLGGNAHFLADLAVREADSLMEMWRLGPEAVVAATLHRLVSMSPATPRVTLAAALRAAKRVVALAVALADLGGLWRLDQVTAHLSSLAEATLDLVVRHLLRAAHEAGDLLLADPDQAAGSGFIVLAMGKLGGRELNYSSDIDLVLLHDPGCARAPAAASALFTRVARGIVSLMQERTADGYVFRVDLRLRPDPGATPLSVALPTAIAYYESLGQNWERAAMIKARPVAGDLAAGHAFLEAIKPFVWRRSLDFAAIADLQAMKRRIDSHKGTDLADGLAGFDVKLGRGGIREIEFLAQTLQLVWGGRDPNLRLPQTVPMLRRLVRAGHLRARASGELIAAYRFLRRVEHRLQMVADRQTHALPEQPASLDRFAVFMGFADLSAFAVVLGWHVRRVGRRYGDLFDARPGSIAAIDSEALAEYGFTEPVPILARLAEWRAGDVRALRSDRARQLLTRILPDLLRALGRQAQPGLAFARFDRLLSRLPAGVPLLSLFDRNRALLERLAAVLGAAAPLAEHLASTPSAIEGLLSPAAPGPSTDLLAQRLTDAAGLEGAIRIVQRTVREEDFAISLATLEGRIDADLAGLRRTALADAAIAALLPRVLADLERLHGSVPGGGLAVVLLGKAGGREMMAGSDLDLIVVYDHPAEVTASLPPESGGKALAPSQWFVRAVHRLVAALTAPDAAGALYAIDMRLRPSGNKGPLAVSLAAFRHYHRPDGEAWTWERMALTRARVVAGAPALCAQVEAAIRQALADAGPAERVRADAVSMRARMDRDAAPRGPPYALSAGKLRPGGLVDVEFIAQATLLTAPHLASAPEVSRRQFSERHLSDRQLSDRQLSDRQLSDRQLSDRQLSDRPRATREVLAALEADGRLDADLATQLMAADLAWRTVLGMARLVVGRDHGREAGDPSGAAADVLLRAIRAVGIDAVDVTGLHATLDRLANDVRAIFTRVIGAHEQP